ncbi:MAG: type 4a pilus biogenesis protein PilO [Polyangia bacterium]
MAALEQLTKMSLAKKLLVLVLLVVLFGVAFWFTYYQPLREELVSLEKKHDRLERDLTDARRSKKTYDEDRRKRDALKKEAAKQLQILPPETEIASFLNNLNTQADLVGLEILSVQPLTEETAEYYARIPVRLRLSGSFHQLSKFFYLVGNLDRIINVENIQLKSPVVDESGVTIQAEVLATTFRSIDPVKG